MASSYVPSCYCWSWYHTIHSIDSWRRRTCWWGRGGRWSSIGWGIGLSSSPSWGRGSTKSCSWCRKSWEEAQGWTKESSCSLTRGGRAATSCDGATGIRANDATTNVAAGDDETLANGRATAHVADAATRGGRGRVASPAIRLQPRWARGCSRPGSQEAHVTRRGGGSPIGGGKLRTQDQDEPYWSQS